MKLARLENQPLKDTIYYILVLWEKENFWGKTFDRAYMTEKAARRKARELINTGKYSAVQLRKEDVLLRDENHEYSSSTPIKRYTA